DSPPAYSDGSGVIRSKPTSSETLAQAIYDAFPKAADGFFDRKSFREKKKAMTDLSHFPEILSNITYAIQHPNACAISSVSSSSTKKWRVWVPVGLVHCCRMSYYRPSSLSTSRLAISSTSMWRFTLKKGYR
ncbi:hypothetical protein PSYAR_08861, partial [Pseudomonas syringae pv. aceris str. M302273]